MTEETKERDHREGDIGFTCLGKQVLVDGWLHYADACDNEAAEVIAQALNERRERLIAESRPRRIVSYRCAPAMVQQS